MVNVVISGIPINAKMQKFMTFIKRKILKCKKDLHVNYTKLISDTTREMSFSHNYKVALKAKKLLDGFQYKLDRRSFFTLQCRLEDLNEEKIDYVPRLNQKVGFYHWDVFKEGSVDKMPVDYESSQRSQYAEMQVDYEPQRKSRRYISPVRRQSRTRSRSRCGSPYHSDELRAIELKIELIKKQRILMEEETKLLLEKRKLEYLQNFGSNDAGLATFEEINRRNDACEISGFLASAESSQPVEKIAPKLPGFIGPCKGIIAQMKALVKTYDEINDENTSIFWNLMRSSVKKRLTILMEGKRYLPTHSIIALYRIRYPVETDKSFVDEILTTIKTSIWPKKSKLLAGNKEGQTTEKQTPTDAEKVNLNEEDTFDTSELVDLDEFVDMENDVENWAEDDDAAGESTVQDEANPNDVTNPEKAEDIKVVEDDKANVTINSADEVEEPQNGDGTEVDKNTEQEKTAGINKQ